MFHSHENSSGEPFTKMTDSKSSNISDIIRGRRTIHNFRVNEVPDDEIILKAIEAAKWAPNHHLTEPWRLYLLGQETINGIIDLNTRLVTEKHGMEAGKDKQERWSKMPGWLVISCNRSDDKLQMHEDYAACCCLIQNLMLYLWSEGIGMKWSTGDVIRDRQFYDLLWIDPQAEEVIGIFWYGYPDDIPVTARKSLEQIIVKLP